MTGTQASSQIPYICLANTSLRCYESVGLSCDRARLVYGVTALEVTLMAHSRAIRDGILDRAVAKASVVPESKVALLLWRDDDVLLLQEGALQAADTMSVDRRNCAPETYS